ncbi:MAG: glycosyltransferase family 2 protein [Clostridia bacterium]|nr:glycosyltransferase family 2 protein [Clostridia bacterium]
MLISIAIPCYKSEKTLQRVVDEIRQVINQTPGYDYQIILVNDYPFDNTFSLIKKLCDEDSKIMGVNLSRNFGQASAKMAAIPYAKGDVLVFMDDDGQHPAEGILPLVEKIQEGYDVVYAYFKSKQHSLFKRVTSKITAKISEFNGTRVKGVHVSSFYAISRFAVDCYQHYDSPFPSMMGYLNTMVGKVTDIEMPHRARLEGTSNYSLKKLLALWLNGFTNFSVKPLRVILTSGAGIAFLGFLMGLTMVIRKLINPAIAAGYTSTMAVLLFLGGLILVALGFIGEYVGRIYMTVSHLQQYRIREIYQNTTERTK